MGKSSGNQTVTNRTELPSWIESFAKSGLSQADKVAGELTPPYQGELVAGMNDMQTGAINAIGGNMGATQGAYNTAQGYAQNVAGYQPNQVAGQSFLDGNISQYMSPYTDAVKASALQTLDDQRLRALNTAGDQAIGAGAFGGSRQGVMEGTLNAEAAKAAGQLSASLDDQAYRQALGAMEGDLARAQQASLANQSAGLQGAGLNLQGAATLGDLASQGQQSFLQGAQAALQAGGMNQMQDQANLDADRARYDAMRNYPLEQLNIRLAALGMTPYGSTTSQTTPTTGSPFLTGLGTAATLASFAPMFGFSDKTMKTDIKKVGKDKETGLDMYSYRYKGDPKTYPKVVGPMAQDVQKKYPDQVKEIGGKLAVNLGFGPMQGGRA